MFVLTIDPEGSRRHGDQVDALLAALAADGGAVRSSAVLRPFERTVGDEVQAVVDDPAVAVAIALDVLDRGGWTVGIGAGPVDLPLPASSRAGAGAAFVHAREAVEAAKGRPRGAAVAVRGTLPDVAAEAEALLVLLGSLAARRSTEGREVVRLLRFVDPAPRQQDLAAALGVSQQAVSARLRAALWAEEVAARPAAARLLRLAADGCDPGSMGER
jgi:hypothetical protein